MKDIFGKWTSLTKEKELKNRYSEYVKIKDKKLGSFLELKLESLMGKTSRKKPLEGIPFAVKDNIAVKGFKMTCGSKILEHFDCPYTATAVEKLEEAGAIVVGKTNLDEFGMGSSTENSALGKTSNPWDLKRVAGGSSGGSASAVAARIVPFALGSDTGGSVRQPASFCGIYGLKPTYGSVSRYGLTAYASTLDTIGICGETTEITRVVFNIMKGSDKRDNTSRHYGDTNIKLCKTIGVLKIDQNEVDSEVYSSYEISQNRLIELGYELKEISMPNLKYTVPAYYIISAAEASSNLARFNGIRYGYSSTEAKSHDELMEKSRHEGFGDEVKLRILLGTYVLRSGFQDQYYHRAQKVRALLKSDFKKLFTQIQALVLPVFPTGPFLHGSEKMNSMQQKVADYYTCSANLTGLPALAIPSSIQNCLPYGIQFMAAPREEDILFGISKRLEDLFPSPVATGYSKEWTL